MRSTALPLRAAGELESPETTRRVFEAIFSLFFCGTTKKGEATTRETMKGLALLGRSRRGRVKQENKNARNHDTRNIGRQSRLSTAIIVQNGTSAHLTRQLNDRTGLRFFLKGEINLFGHLEGHLCRLSSVFPRSLVPLGPFFFSFFFLFSSLRSQCCFCCFYCARACGRRLHKSSGEKSALARDRLLPLSRCSRGGRVVRRRL